nr:hypothetical protein [Massilia sp. Dwa41.01b]
MAAADLVLIDGLAGDEACQDGTQFRQLLGMGKGRERRGPQFGFGPAEHARQGRIAGQEIAVRAGDGEDILGDVPDAVALGRALAQ